LRQAAVRGDKVFCQPLERKQTSRVAHTSRGFCRDVCGPRYVDAITAFRPCPRSNRHSRDRTSPPRRDLGRSRGCSTGPPFTGWLCV
jgi:hypothetical protein